MRNSLDDLFETMGRGNPQKGAQVIITLSNLLVIMGRKKEQQTIKSPQQKVIF